MIGRCEMCMVNCLDCSRSLSPDLSAWGSLLRYELCATLELGHVFPSTYTWLKCPAELCYGSVLYALHNYGLENFTGIMQCWNGIPSCLHGLVYGDWGIDLVTDDV